MSPNSIRVISIVTPFGFFREPSNPQHKNESKTNQNGPCRAFGPIVIYICVSPKPSGGFYIIHPTKHQTTNPHEPLLGALGAHGPMGTMGPKGFTHGVLRPKGPMGPMGPDGPKVGQGAEETVWAHGAQETEGAQWSYGAQCTLGPGGPQPAGCSDIGRATAAAGASRPTLQLNLVPYVIGIFFFKMSPYISDVHTYIYELENSKISL